MTLLVVTVVWLMANLGLTAWMKPALFNRAEFWVLQVCALTKGDVKLYRYVDDKTSELQV